MIHGKIFNYIGKDNQDCLIVYYKLLEAFQRSEKYASPYLNLVAVFFHELMFILTGYVLRRNEIECPYKPSEKQMSSELKEFPYIDYKDILHGIKIENKEFTFKNSSYSYKYKIISLLSGLKKIYLRKSKRIVLTHIDIDFKKLLLNIITGNKVDFVNSGKIFVPDIEPQLHEIKNSVEQIFETLHLPGNSDDIFKLIRRHIQLYYSSTETNKIDYSIVVTGTLLDINNRILAAKARSQNIPVITLAHGACDGVLDEPVFGYGDRSFARYFIGYSEDAMKCYERGLYTKTLYESPKYIMGDSNIARSLYKGGFVESLKNIENRKLMYVPTGLPSNLRYGPFRDMSAQLYKVWQESLIYEFPGIIYKAYPKGKRDPSLLPSNATQIIFHKFQECLDMADLFVFDYMSTAFAIAAATSKPIIFFNIGLRNYSKSGLRMMKKRCIWIDVDPANPGDLREKVESSKYKECINEFTESFSLHTDNDRLSREEVLFKIINKVIGKRHVSSNS